jgi:hypothetical protein
MPFKMLAEIPQALPTVLLQPLAALLREASCGDIKTAWENATAAIRLYAPKTETELRFAVRTLMFDIQANQAAAQAAAQTGDVAAPLNQPIRARSSAISMTRKAGKAERRLNECRAARLAALAAESANKME